MHWTTKDEDSTEVATRALDPGATGADSDPVLGDAIEQLRCLLDEARRRGLEDGDTASLATADTAGRPSVRTVTIADVDAAGPMFFVDARSGKGQQLADNPRAALCFFWPGLRYQVSIEGTVAPIASTRADHLWARRGRDQQLAAWIGDMEPEIGGGSGNGGRRLEIGYDFAWQRVARPESWHCLVLQPDMFRFWSVGWRNPRPLKEYCRHEDGTWRKNASSPLLAVRTGVGE
jgi:pyridoxamine 5'-phosphate oxidase